MLTIFLNDGINVQTVRLKVHSAKIDPVFMASQILTILLQKLLI